MALRTAGVQEYKLQRSYCITAVRLLFITNYAATSCQENEHNANVENERNQS